MSICQRGGCGGPDHQPHPFYAVALMLAAGAVLLAAHALGL
jgi:hypothetical protein